MEAATVKAPSARLVAFLDALRTAGEEEWCSPPGLFGHYKVRHIRKGLEAGALVVHHSGRGLALSAEPVKGDSRKITMTDAVRRWEHWTRMEDEQAPKAPAFSVEGASRFLRVVHGGEPADQLLLTD